ncbi:amidase [Halorussus salinisoli]|uniref:amidase n=1 Tax=Halorussus salinisoli TaxID=2558242 RepID=UPI0010C1CC21|nr:amidase [Halorussus salinisoli]
MADEPNEADETSLIATDAVTLAEAASALRTGRRDVVKYVERLHDRIESVEPTVHALVPEPGRSDRLTAEAAALRDRYPEPRDRPPLYGVPVGVKDIFHTRGLPTRAGSDLPISELTGAEGSAVAALRDAGALVLGKTVTTEFAYFEPGPTRNPHDPQHTPGGSSSGSAAAVAAGETPLALGTQTVGSTIRPAAFCGIVGFKPSYDRIPTDGVLPLAESVDHVGAFTRDVTGMRVAASVLCDDWETVATDDRPVLGVPTGPYLSQATEVGLDQFDAQVEALERAGYEVRRVRLFNDIDALNERHDRLVAAEAALAHAEWVDEYGDRYAAETADLVREGQSVTVEEVAAVRASRRDLRAEVAAVTAEEGVDVWISPAAPGPAPEGIDGTGDPVMNLPWTHAGVPAVSLPGGRVDGLPVGLQCVGSFMDDERLLARAQSIAAVLAEAFRQ